MSPNRFWSDQYQQNCQGASTKQLSKFVISTMEGLETETFAALESKPWDPIELVLASAKDYGPVRPSNLQATANFPLHAFFNRGSWSSVSDEDYNLIRPSMQLASNLIQVGMPYLCSFVPSSRAHDHLADRRAHIKSSYQIDPQLWTEEDIHETRDELLRIANCVDWELNDTIARDNKWLGITRLVTSEKWGSPLERSFKRRYH
ncbi:hypothetical protein BKA64DRAFT_106448 [Cadophora sp. MPI-SDFR-AT-0126]|nr:hypothetical protein BKA64DRAFT_106448 [Leotiomycetes sp. MPI-SDFR-AT-0126]